MNSKQSSHENDGLPISTSNPSNQNPPILQERRENSEGLPQRVGERVVLQNPSVQIPQQPNNDNQRNPVEMTTIYERPPHQTQPTQHTFHRSYTTLQNPQPSINVAQTSRHNTPSTSNSRLPSEQGDNYKSENLLTDRANNPHSNENLLTDQANYSCSNVSSTESQLPELQEFDVEASFEALHKLSVLDVENMPIGVFTEYLRHALLCAENIANRNEQKYCFRNIESICRRTRLEVEKQNFTARNLYNQGYPYAIKDFIFALARTTNCWRILSGYCNAIKNNLLIGQVNIEIGRDFLKCFAEWEKANKRLTHNLFQIFSNLDLLYTDEEVSESQNDASRPRYTYQPRDQTNREQYFTHQEQFSRYREKSSTESENNDVGQEWDPSSAWGITRSKEFESSSSGDNIKQSPVHQYQSAQSSTNSSEENKVPSKSFILKPEQFPPLGERIRRYHREPSMEYVGRSTGTLKKTKHSNAKRERNAINREQATTRQKQFSKESVSANSADMKKMEYLGPSTGAIKKTTNSNSKPEKSPVQREQVASYQRQSSTRSEGANSQDMKKMEYVGPSTGAIKKTTNSSSKPEKSPVQREQVASYQKQSSTGSIGTNSQDMKKMEYLGPSTGAIKKTTNSNSKPEQQPLHQEHVPLYQKQSLTESASATFTDFKKMEYVGPSTGAIKKVYQEQVITKERPIKKTRSVDLNQEPILLHHQQSQTHLVQPPIENTGSNSGIMNVTGDDGFKTIHTSAVNQEYLRQMQYPTASAPPSSDNIRTTSNYNFPNEQPSADYHLEYRQSSTHQMQPSAISAGLRSDIIEMTNHYEQQPLTNTYFQSSESHGSQYNLDQTTANYGYGRDSYETFRLGSYEASRRGSYEPSRRSSYESFRRGSYEPSRRGSYEPSRRGSYEPYRRGTYEPYRRGRYHNHFAYDRGISLIPTGYNYLVQFSYKAKNIDKYQEKLLKDAELLAKSTAMAVLNDKDDEVNLNAKVKSKHADAKTLLVKLKEIWIRLEETHFMVQNINRPYLSITLQHSDIIEPINLRTVGNRILQNSYRTAHQFVQDIRHVLIDNNLFYEEDIEYQINLAMFEILLNDLLKEVFPDLNFDDKEYKFPESAEESK